MLRRLGIASILFASLATMLLAQQKPNFSGTWKLNVAKSDFGILPPPESQTTIIEHSDPAIKMTVDMVGAQGTMNYTLDATTDGKENAVKMGPRDVKVAFSWEGTALNVNSKLSFNDQEVTLKSIWSLSADGKVFTQNTHITSAMGELDQKFVFDKQTGDSMPTTTSQAMPKASEPAKTMIGTAASSGPRPNFSGVWKLNVAKSDFGVMPGPDMRTDTIEQTATGVKLSRDENGPDGPRKYVINSATDGTEVVNNLGPTEAKVTGSWDGNSLVTVTKLKFQEQDVTIKQISTLSEDGKTLTNKTHLVSAMGEMDQKEVYEKQP